MTPVYLTRARLRPDLDAATLARALLAEDENANVAAAHRLVWMLFSDGSERRRDFLWRAETPGSLATTTFYLLSARPPEDRWGIFALDPPKPFAPNLRPGDRLCFALRANPVVTRKDASGRPHRHDVVMDRLHRAGIGPGARAAHRREAMEEAARAWLEAQAARCGFALAHGPSGAPLLSVDGYEQRVVPRVRARPVVFSVLDLQGVLEVREPELFFAAVVRGFGKAKAWGCGLMLLRRA
ncbi:MAG: type I-E CRISPR-associated protein Cas6/Cse3/CasE [Geminicoccaceae bacterium]|nr:type I-E CRISPR-associated protein Cas6/Cse3/CasE [Geminicoccaceae bacterium]MDW8342757.1 type I-E CRISPR-associated protein Cas6/Cse3/CasE [Geminicoccaceae bacterium]